MSTQDTFDETAADSNSGNNNSSSTRPTRWWLFAPALVIIWVVGMIDKTGIGIIAADKGFLADMHIAGEPAQVGLLTTITLVFYGASMPVWGSLIDRFGPRRCVIAGLVFWGVSTLIAGFAGSYTVLVAARALLGVSQGFLWPVSNALTARWFPLAERGRAKSVWIGGINLGFALSGFVVSGSMGLWNWQGAFFVLTALALVVCLPAAWFLLHDDPATTPRVPAAERALIEGDSIEGDSIGADSIGADSGAGGTSADGANELRTWPYWVMVVAWIANNMGVFGLASWFPTYLESEQHVAKSTASDLIALAFVLCIVVAPFVGLGMDRLRRKAIWSVAGFALAAVFLLLASVVSSPGFQLTAVIIAIVGIEGFTTLAGQGVLHSMAPARRMGRANGVMSGVGNFVGAFGALIMGALIGAGGFPAAFTFLIVVFFIGAGLSLVLHFRKY